MEEALVCNEPGCDMSFPDEDQLSLHCQTDHSGSPSLPRLSMIPTFVADQTPTPTQFLKTCEEAGLFQLITDHPSKNPFDGDFKRGTEQNEQERTAARNKRKNTPKRARYLNMDDVSGERVESSNDVRRQSVEDDGTHAPIPYVILESLGDDNEDYDDGGDSSELVESERGEETTTNDASYESYSSSVGRQDSQVHQDVLFNPITPLLTNQQATVHVAPSIKQSIAGNVLPAAATPERQYIQVLIQLADGQFTPVQIPVDALMHATPPTNIAPPIIEPITPPAPVIRSPPAVIQIVAPALQAMPVLTHAAPMQHGLPTTSWTVKSATAHVQQQPVATTAFSLIPATVMESSAAMQTGSSGGIKLTTKELLRAKSQQHQMASGVNHASQKQNFSADNDQQASMMERHGARIARLSPRTEGNSSDQMNFDWTPSSIQSRLLIQDLQPLETLSFDWPRSSDGGYVQLQAADTSTHQVSPHSSVDDDVRKQQFLESNRAAATRCRNKKRTWVSNLETKAQDLQNVNKRLTHETAALRNEIQQLKHALEEHKDCLTPS